MTQIAHDVAGTTYYACAECGACPCPDHGRFDHDPECSHRIPDEWWTEPCGMHPDRRAGSFMLCSACQYPPCYLTGADE